MDTLEIFLLTSTTAGIILIQRPVFTKVRLLIGILITALIVANFIFNGFRWVIVPILIVGSYVICRSIFLKESRRHFSLKFLKWSGLSVLLAVAWILPISFPLFQLPSPTGLYAVGTQWIHLVDSSRDETITASPLDKRELMAKIWYPTDIQKGSEDAYLLKSERTGFAQKYGFPDWTLSYLDRVRTHVITNVDIASGKFPVLIFSHGYESPATNYYSFLTDIASHGYIIVNINHTYESISSEFPDGQVRLRNDSFSVATNLNPKMIELAWNSTEKFNKAKSEEERLQVVTELVHHYSGSTVVRRWAKDISFVIDQMELSNKTSNSFLYNKLDLSRLGAFGHSLGGAAAGQALINDSRLLAAANWDGSQFGDVVDTIFQKPFMLLNHSVPLRAGFEINPLVYHRKSQTWFYDVVVDGTGHSNYSDIPYWITPKFINEAGEIDMDRGVTIINNITLAFFDKHLLKKSISIENLSKEFIELQIKTSKGEMLK